MRELSADNGEESRKERERERGARAVNVQMQSRQPVKVDWVSARGIRGEISANSDTLSRGNSRLRFFFAERREKSQEKMKGSHWEVSEKLLLPIFRVS